jgi:hypothetical protein
MNLKYNAENILTIGSITLRPGTNFDVNEAEFEKYKSTLVVKSKLQSGIIQVIQPVLTENKEENGTDSNAASGLSEFSAQEAKQLILDCNDLEKLEYFEEAEGRPSVLKAIRKKISEIKDEDQN